MKTLVQHILLCQVFSLALISQAVLAAESSIVNTTKSNTKDFVQDKAPEAKETPTPEAQQQINKSKSNVKNNKQSAEGPAN